MLSSAIMRMVVVADLAFAMAIKIQPIEIVRKAVVGDVVLNMFSPAGRCLRLGEMAGAVLGATSTITG
ncbi:hypothetical protein [Bradyrhizobium australiense]|uniref:Uncharacterized protein n=1 Tax=Bradyrhizobium australiense TaxID=2721161 RepID=A0A7Y4LZP8_9BRAD|nr:hypothetical protein [Bradyrhizobium australiense]NOJ44564.1 hypothetical protein [Bradyrhizobium australiense]